MKKIYTYPIIGQIALSLHIITKSIHYILKNPALLIFPIIAWVIPMILFSTFSLLLLVSLPASGSPNFFYGSLALLTITIYSLFFITRLYMGTALAHYIQAIDTQKKPNIKHSLLFAYSKSNLLLKISLLPITIFLILFFTMPINSYNPNISIYYLFMLVAFLLPYIPAIAAYEESMSIGMCIKKSIFTLIQMPIASLLIFPLGFFMPLPEILLYRHIHKQKIYSHTN